MAPAWGPRLPCLALEVAVGNQLWGQPWSLRLSRHFFLDPACCWERCCSRSLVLRLAPAARQQQTCAAPCSPTSPWAQCGREAIFRNTSWVGLGSARHETKKHIHLNPLLSPLRELGFVFKSIWQATKLAESVSWLATRSKNAVLSPPSFPPPPPPFPLDFVFSLLHLATVSCIDNKPLSASFSLGARTSGSWFLFSESV